MTTAQNLVYSKAAAARILNIDPLLIKNLEIWQNIILVRICDRRAKFISKMDKRSSELGTYYAVEFEWQESQEERVEELKAFISQHQLYAARMNDRQVELPPLPAAKSVTEDTEVDF